MEMGHGHVLVIVQDLFITLYILPNIFCEFDLISKFNLSLEIYAISKPEKRPEKIKQVIINTN